MKFSIVKKIIPVLSLVFVFGATFFYAEAYADSEILELSYFDIGQGDAVLIETPFGQNILIDGGPDSSIIERMSEELPWWDRTIDLMILTHPHDDHINGQMLVLDRYEVLKVLHTGILYDSSVYLEWKNTVREKNIPVILAERPQSIMLGENCRIEILYPESSFISESKQNINNSSIVFKLVYGENSFLFTGDAESEVEEYFLENSINLHSDVIKLAHHGSDTSSSQNFLEAVSPEAAVISVGEENDFGHPSQRVINRLKRMGIDLYRIDDDGSINMKSDGINYTIFR